MQTIFFKLVELSAKREPPSEKTVCFIRDKTVAVIVKSNSLPAKYEKWKDLSDIPDTSLKVQAFSLFFGNSVNIISDIFLPFLICVKVSSVSFLTFVL